jgi:hypothetical protein
MRWLLRVDRTVESLIGGLFFGGFLMPAIVECDCGRRFNAKDELRGHEIPCPGCGASLLVPLAPPPLESSGSAPRASSSKPGGSAFNFPGAAKPQHPNAKKGSPRFSITGMQVFYISLFIIVPTIIYLIKIGPVAAGAKWEKDMPVYTDEITDVVGRFLFNHRKKQGVDMTKVQNVPKVQNVVIDAPPMIFRYPRSFAFQGSTTEGKFNGTFTTSNHSLKSTIEVDGGTLPIDATVTDGNVVYNTP